MDPEKLDRARSVVRATRSYTSGFRAFKLLKTITLHHRIQASRGLADAVQRLEGFLLEESPDNVEVYSFKYTGKAGPEWLSLPAKWEVYDAWVEVGGERYTYAQHPTLPAAHTPPSDGVVEGEVARVSDPLDEREYERNRDKVVLVTGHHRVAYRLAAENGVPAVIIADESRHHDSFPYFGLFLTPEEASRYSTVAVTLPWRVASGVEGKRAALRVDSDLGGPGELPVLVAWMGERTGEGPSLVAHICHPSPGANDNASGSSAAVEAFLAVASAVEEGALSAPEESIRLILLPEYTGSILSMEGWLSRLPGPGLNLDMVGRVREYSTPPRLLYPPVTVGASPTGDAYYDAATVGGAGFPVEYYMAGSDHDVYLAYGRDSVMINQWPDAFYHTDSDDADTISKKYLEEVAYTAAAVVYLLATRYEPTPTARRILVESMVAKHVSRGELDSARLASGILPLRYGLGWEAPYPGTEWTPVRDDRVVKPRVPLYAGLTTLPLSLHEAVEFTRKLEGLSLPREVYSEVFYAGGRGYTLSRLHSELAAVYGVRDMEGERLRGLLSLFEEYGLISLA